MKNIIIRVKDGVVCVSSPHRVPIKEIDRVVESKADWIQEQLTKPPTPNVELKFYDKEVCLEKFNKIAESVYPLIKDKLPQQPNLYVKDYRSRWGVCYYKRNYIILSTRLYDKPIPAIEYVYLHELLHFLIPNHGKEFYALLVQLMPDYKERRKLLKLHGDYIQS